MKIIGGQRKGHNLVTPAGLHTRPTLSRIRESLFNITANDIPGTVFCELFAGSGSIGLEALSRGADACIFVENDKAALNSLRKNITALRYNEQSTVVNTDVFRWQFPTGPHAPDIIFADPPYQAETIHRLEHHIAASPLKPDSLIIIQAPVGYQPSQALRHLRSTKYGNTSLHFFLPPVSEGNQDQPTGSR